MYEIKNAHYENTAYCSKTIRIEKIKKIKKNRTNKRLFNFKHRQPKD